MEFKFRANLTSSWWATVIQNRAAILYQPYMSHPSARGKFGEFSEISCDFLHSGLLVHLHPIQLSQPIEWLNWKWHFNAQTCTWHIAYEWRPRLTATFCSNRYGIGRRGEAKIKNKNGHPGSLSYIKLCEDWRDRNTADKDGMGRGMVVTNTSLGIGNW
jgi:hypothetical protein